VPSFEQVLRLPDNREIQVVVVKLPDGRLVVRTAEELAAAGGRRPGELPR
jgi:hypothetical protein